MFNIYIVEAINERNDEIQVGVRMGGENIIALQFANKIVLCRHWKGRKFIHYT